MKLYRSEKWLRLQYITNSLTEDEIAEKAGADRATINRWLRKFNLKRVR